MDLTTNYNDSNRGRGENMLKQQKYIGEYNIYYENNIKVVWAVLLHCV